MGEITQMIACYFIHYFKDLEIVVRVAITREEWEYQGCE